MKNKYLFVFLKVTQGTVHDKEAFNGHRMMKVHIWYNSSKADINNDKSSQPTHLPCIFRLHSAGKGKKWNADNNIVLRWSSG